MTCLLLSSLPSLELPPHATSMAQRRGLRRSLLKIFCLFMLVSWDSGHHRTHTLRRRAAERKLRYGEASCNFFWFWMDYGWRRVVVLLAKIFLYRLVILCSFIGTRGITGHMLFGVAQRRKFSSMVKLVFIFIWVLDGLNTCAWMERKCAGTGVFRSNC